MSKSDFNIYPQLRHIEDMCSRIEDFICATQARIDAAESKGSNQVAIDGAHAQIDLVRRKLRELWDAAAIGSPHGWRA